MESAQIQSDSVVNAVSYPTVHDFQNVHNFTLSKRSIYLDHTYVSIDKNISLKPVSIAFLNVCGLENKLCVPEFIEHVQKYEFFACAETKCNFYDDKQIEGYVPFANDFINENLSCRSGGVCLFVRETISNNCSVLKSKHNQYVLWIAIGQVLVGVVYVAPEGSKYSVVDLYEYLEQDITTHLIENELTSCFLIGDFNARTGLLSDVVEMPNELVNFCIDDESSEIIFENKYTCGPRLSSDKNVNKHGKKLLSLCKGHNMQIVNGRFGKKPHKLKTLVWWITQ